MEQQTFRGKIYSEANIASGSKKSLQIARKKVTTDFTFWVNPKDLSFEEIGVQVKRHLLLDGHKVIGDVEVKKVKMI